MGFWAKVRRDYLWALAVALVGATAGVIFVAATGGLVFSEIWKGAVTGAILASVIFTAIKLWLD